MSSTVILKKIEIDPVLAEVRRIKEEIAAEHGYDIRRIVAATRKLQIGNPDRIVSRIAIDAEGVDPDPNA
ncbi:MAG: hypothetical protein QM496_19810 [Verrucomicrobiota bacterium]